MGSANYSRGQQNSPNRSHQPSTNRIKGMLVKLTGSSGSGTRCSNNSSLSSKSDTTQYSCAYQAASNQSLKSTINTGCSKTNAYCIVRIFVMVPEEFLDA